MKLVNGLTPIFSLNNGFVWHAADIKFRVDVDLVRGCLALESYVAFNAEVGELLFSEDLEDYLGQIFVSPPAFVTHPVNLARRDTCRKRSARERNGKLFSVYFSCFTRAKKLTQAIIAKTFRGELVPTEAELARREGHSYESASTLLALIRAERESFGARAKTSTQS